MRTRVRKWGNSLALRIPKSFAAETLLEPDSEVQLSLVEGKLVITPIGDTELSLESLLSSITEDNRHAEIDTGAPSGNEVW